jgi:hypothetical protein
MGEEHLYGIDLIDRYGYGDYHLEYDGISIKNKGLVIPEVLFRVIKKNISDISSIEIDSYKREKKFNPNTFEPIPIYIVFLDVIYDWNTDNILNPEKLGESINTSFSMIFNNIDFIEFRVRTVTVKKRDYNQEFLDIFTNKK